MPKRRNAAENANGATVGYEAQLWQMADALRGSMDALPPIGIQRAIAHILSTLETTTIELNRRMNETLGPGVKDAETTAAAAI